MMRHVQNLAKTALCSENLGYPQYRHNSRFASRRVGDNALLRVARSLFIGSFRVCMVKSLAGRANSHVHSPNCISVNNYLAVGKKAGYIPRLHPCHIWSCLRARLPFNFLLSIFRAYLVLHGACLSWYPAFTQEKRESVLSACLNQSCRSNTFSEVV